ncbi:hypothetical protein EVAR_28445_1 [Eumeta japonica]|uniref:Uncharacterized protein n=1 Tax=Eumeta variegata TaxID=151549 RepID=A0A4C1V8W4_EUMVA|nr:hypothetical protein EVAR_28445_1 [Eumeta japonica]
MEPRCGQFVCSRKWSGSTCEIRRLLQDINIKQQFPLLPFEHLIVQDGATQNFKSHTSEEFKNYSQPIDVKKRVRDQPIFCMRDNFLILRRG